VNSPILSPGHAAFGTDVISSPAIECLFVEFLKRNGPFDVVHFNNLEGIPVSFLRLAREHAPRVRVIYSMHNYYAICPQVNLWFQEKSTCKDFRAGRKCVNCLVVKPQTVALKWRYRIEHVLGRLGMSPRSGIGQKLRDIWFETMRLLYRSLKMVLPTLSVNKAPGTVQSSQVVPGQRLDLLDASTADRFQARRRDFVAAVNSNVDHVLAVSNRVAELAIQYGIDTAKVRTIYIGTKFANQAPVNPQRVGSHLHKQREARTSPYALSGIHAPRQRVLFLSGVSQETVAAPGVSLATGICDEN
jgi:hypothetical protein